MTIKSESAIEIRNYMEAAGEIFSSLRLRDVLDAIVDQYSRLSETGKAAVFLADNENKCFKLMAVRGYAEISQQEMRVVPFSWSGIFSEMLSRKAAVVVRLGGQLSGFSKTIFGIEQSAGQIAIPLQVQAFGLLVGAVLLDSGNLAFKEESHIEMWQKLADIASVSTVNAIVFGHIEYERQRLNALYKILLALNESSLSIETILQKTADAALVLANTPYCAVLMRQPDNDQFALAAFKGLDGSSLSEFQLEQHALAVNTLQEGKTQQLSKNDQQVHDMPRAMGGGVFHSVLALPLIYKEDKIGVLFVFSTDENAFHQEQVDLLETLASQVSPALSSAEKHQSVLQKILHDPHTGLLNRFYFTSALQTEIERSKRHKHQLGLLLIDIDFFSRINDLFGEEKGDAAIAAIGQTIKSTLRQIDLIYRFGGEQFAVILPETPATGVLEAANRVRETIRNKMLPDLGTVTVSIGACTYPDHGHGGEQLAKLVEQALDMAKYQGRDKVVAPGFVASDEKAQSCWADLAAQAKFAVAGERQQRAKSHLSGAIDYANWLIKTRTGTQEDGKNHVQLP